MRSKFWILFFFFFILGCSTRSMWVDGMNGMVGESYCRHYNYFWSPSNKNKSFDRVEVEGGGRRYYITWYGECKYSIYVERDGLIRSWRYETNNMESCYVPMY